MQWTCSSIWVGMSVADALRNPFEFSPIESIGRINVSSHATAQVCGSARKNAPLTKNKKKKRAKETSTRTTTKIKTTIPPSYIWAWALPSPCGTCALVTSECRSENKWTKPPLTVCCRHHLPYRITIRSECALGRPAAVHRPPEWKPFPVFYRTKHLLL